jgi:hypothetical protein
MTDVLIKAYPMVPLPCRSDLAGRYLVPLSFKMFLPVKGFGSGSRCLDGEVREAKPEKIKKQSGKSQLYSTPA